MPSSTSDHHAPDRSTTSAGSEARITVVRDLWGIPHVRAGSALDAFFGNGFVHAQDRLWQMDAARRRAVGRFAEWIGPSGAALDVLARRMDVEGVSRLDFAALGADTTAMLERYAAGVNAFMDRGDLPREYALLGEAPEPWEPWHSVAVMRQRGLLMGSIWFKLWRAAAVRAIGPDLVGLLRYDDGGPERFVTPQGQEGRRWVASLVDLKPALDAIAEMAPSDATVAGSNNWAVDGRHTRSGKPMVAGDPHRAFEIPGMYAQLHLTCEEFDVLGFSVPGVPAFPHFGHSERVAWCVTHAFADLHDLYVERFDGPDSYAVPGGVETATIREETVTVRGADPQTVRCVTTRHGPIIVGDPDDGHALALRSVQLQPEDHSLECLWPMMTAGTIHDFYEATRGWGVVDHNLVAADVDGHVGVSIRAIVPKRDRVNGWLPVPGWAGTHEWGEMIAFERMPREIDPPSGRVVTANNRPVPEDWPDYISTDCHPSARAHRITARLDGLEAIEVDDMVDILRDTRSARAIEFRDAILVAEANGAAKTVQDALVGWDGRMDPGLVAPSAYTLVRQEMTRIVARRSGLARADAIPFGALPGNIPTLTQLWWTVPNLMRADDVRLLGGASWADIVAEALETVSARWEPEAWGTMHRPLFAHPLGVVFPQDADALAPSSDPSGGDGDCVCAIGAYPAGGPRASYGSVARYVFDLGDWDRSRWIVFHGTSGHPGTRHYSDQNPFWARGELVGAPYSRAAVDAHAASVSTIDPPR